MSKYFSFKKEYGYTLRKLAEYLNMKPTQAWIAHQRGELHGMLDKLFGDIRGYRQWIDDQDKEEEDAL